MKSRKYPTLQSALDHLKSIGTLTYGGWEGQRDGKVELIGVKK